MLHPDFQKLQTAIKTDVKLYSVFERITLGNALIKLNNQHDLRLLTNDTIVSPEKKSSKEQLKTDLEGEFQQDSLQLGILSEAALKETLPYLFQKYAWRAGNPERKDDNELAVAFCDAFRLKKIFENGDQEFILLKGDLAGIQNYIYGNIQPEQTGGLRDIAKKLRGRSLIVSLLTDFLAGVMLRELELSTWHLLFAGGGHFNLLLPKNKETPAMLKVLSEDLDSQMRRRFGENLQLIIAHLDFSKKEITENPSECFSKLVTKLEKQKQQQHKKYLHDHFFTEIKPTADAIVKRRKEIEKWEIEIGEQLPKRDFIVEAVSSAPIYNTLALPEIVTFEMHRHCYSLLVPENWEVAKTLLTTGQELISAQVFSINNTNFLEPAEFFNNPKISFGFRFLGKTLPLVFDEKKQRDVPKTFEEIVEANNDANKMLAAIRLDVDDLGFIFNKGMPDASLGEILTLSREMQYFFSAHFDFLAAQKKEDGFENDHDLYLIYSGGDDAFAVGKWDNVIHFAQKLRADFREFTFKNPDLHFSAGIFTGNPHYPVGRFYLDAGKLQDAAKDSERKNRVKIFNQTLDWEEFDSKIRLGKKFADVFEGHEADMKKLPSAFAYRILNLVKSSFRELPYEDHDGSWYNRGSINTERFSRNVAGLRYFLARQGFDQKRSQEAVSSIEKELIWDFMKSFDFNGDDEKIYPIRDYLVALNYAIFKNRAKASLNHKTV